MWSLNRRAVEVDLNAGQEDQLSELLAPAASVFERAVDAAVVSREGDRVLARADAALKGWRLTVVAAALGDVDGPDGGPALRGLLNQAGAGSQDSRCAAVLALVKREGKAATADLVAALKSRNGAVRDYAILGLAAVGDGRGWDEVFAHLSRRLTRTPRPVAHPPEAAVGVTYLLAEAGDRRERVEQVVGLLRDNWEHLTFMEHGWLEEHWPQVAPDGPPAPAVLAPDGQALRRLLATDALFGPSIAPRTITPDEGL